MILNLSQIDKSFGAQQVFENLQFEIKGKEKISLVGRNGSGKTTLMNIISGLEPIDKGFYHKKQNLSIGYLQQMAFEDEELTLDQELEKVFVEIKELEEEINQTTQLLKEQSDEKLLNKLSNLQQRYEMMDGYTYESEKLSLLTSFGFSKEDLSRKIHTFSGGQKTRLGFVKMFLSKPDVLLLDEPTNHLDISTIEWLENYLKAYPSAIVLTSHDRLFLDRVCDTVVELSNQQATRYKGNYSSYLAQREVAMAKQEQLYQYQQKEIDRLETLIEKFRYKKNKAAFAKSKQKYLDRMDVIESPQSSQKAFKAHFTSKIRGGKNVLLLQDCVVGYDEPLFKLSLELRRQMRMAVIGDNGTGKSTLLKSIIGQVPFLSGEMLLGHQIEIGYFEQNLDQFDETKTVLEELWDEYPQLNKTEIRTVLGTFLFSGDDVFKSVAVLSGGEKVRLALCKLMLKKANFLILDEPTNHLDIESKEALEKALLDYDGTILFVSHDRYFIQKISNSILKIENKEVMIDELEVKKLLESKPQKFEKTSKNKEDDQLSDYELSQLKRRLKKQSEKLLEEIDEAETRLEELRDFRYEPEFYHDFEKMNQLNQDIDDVHNQIAHLVEEWTVVEEELAGLD